MEERTLEELKYPIGHFVFTKTVSGGWTIRQVVHHIADSHHHSYTRFKWALTEDRPVIKAYDEKEWSNLFDANTAPIVLSLNYLKALHAKLVYLLKGLSKEDLERVYIHPDGNVEVSLLENIGKYAWHGNHHLAHIEGYRDSISRTGVIKLTAIYQLQITIKEVEIRGAGCFIGFCYLL